MNVLDNGVHFLKDYLDRYAMKAWFIRDVNYIRIRTNINTLNATRSENTSNFTLHIKLHRS